jgi:hypothetical protein
MGGRGADVHGDRHTDGQTLKRWPPPPPPPHVDPPDSAGHALHTRSCTHLGQQVATAPLLPASLVLLRWRAVSILNIDKNRRDIGKFQSKQGAHITETTARSPGCTPCPRGAPCSTSSAVSAAVPSCSSAACAASAQLCPVRDTSFGSAPEGHCQLSGAIVS